MYKEFETKTSYKYLQEVIKALEEPICILGGWAIFFHVNENFLKKQGRPYLGSKDIDLGFHLDKNSTINQMEKSALTKSLDILQNNLKFRPISFRLLKEIHIETEEELTNSKDVPNYNIFQMYVDPLVDNIPKKFKEVFKFQPADEPLLNYAFENIEYREELEEFNKKLLLPKPELLLATKINAIIFRDKEHKKIKDICDMFALLWYAGENPSELSRKVTQFISKKKIKQSIASIKAEDYNKASKQLSHSSEEIKKIIETLQE